MRRQTTPVVVFLASLVLQSSIVSVARTKTTEEPRDITLRGKVVCLDQSGKAGDCSQPGRQFALESAGGHLYKVSPADEIAEIFVDPRVRERILQVTARINRSGTLEVIRVRSIRDGKLYDISYYCDVCNITTNAMGLCPCCRKELEFVETPAQIPDL